MRPTRHRPWPSSRRCASGSWPTRSSRTPGWCRWPGPRRPSRRPAEVSGPRVGVVTFPGSLDDRDALRAVAFMGGDPVPLWHGEADLGGAEAVVLPGGFSYGDYLRTGATARFAPIMDPIRSFADSGGPVLGICNGFQILCEAGLLPGALIRNRGLAFICRWVNVVVHGSSLAGDLVSGDVLGVPIKHGEGQFVASAEELAS